MEVITNVQFDEVISKGVVVIVSLLIGVDHAKC